MAEYDWRGIYDKCPNCGCDRGDLSSRFGARFSVPPWGRVAVWWCWKCDPRQFTYKVKDLDNYPNVDYEGRGDYYSFDGVKGPAEDLRDY